MNSLNRVSMGGLFIFISLTVFGSGFWTAYRQDQTAVERAARFAELHLVYAVSLKDDMAVIDWSKNLSGDETILFFQAAMDSKVVVEGGNRAYLTRGPESGTAYEFPNQWIYNDQTSTPSGSLHFQLVCRSKPGPFLWGLLAFACALAGGLGIIGMPVRHGFETKTPSLRAQSPAPIPSLAPESPLNFPGKLYLRVDQNLVIQEASREAEFFLNRAPKSLVGSHFLDLAPDPRLIEAFHQGQEAKLENAFLSPPGLSATVKNDSNGGIIVFLLDGTSTG